MILDPLLKLNPCQITLNNLLSSSYSYSMSYKLLSSQVTSI